MKVGVITTTIGLPIVLELYRRHGPDVKFFIALDQNSDFDGMALHMPSHEQYSFLTPDYQKKWKCSEPIGWKNIQRRNIALLEAVAWGADLLISIDDDNLCMDRSYFKHFADVCRGNYFTGYGGGFEAPRYFNGIKVSGLNGWFDIGQLLDPIAPHRGFPISHGNDLWRADHVTNAKVGVAAGICLGDPDVSAVTRITSAPLVHRVSQLLESGIVVDPGTHTVFNSQNTAFIRELAPAFFMLPGVGRYDDIYASLIMQRVMRERNLHVHFGKPFVWQQRNQHNLVKDLAGEIAGMEYIERFASFLDRLGLSDQPPLTNCRLIWEAIGDATMEDHGVPVHIIDAALAFLDDIEQVL